MGNRTQQSAIYQHLSSCVHYNYLVYLCKLQNDTRFNIQQIRDSKTVIDRAYNWNILLFKEAYMVRTHRPSLNCELKVISASKLFFVILMFN